MSKCILSLVLHSFETDNRVLRACDSLISTGFDVKVAALQERDLPLQEQFGKVHVERIVLWTRSWPKWRPIQFIKYVEWGLRISWRYRQYDIIHCNDINTLPAGILLKILTRGRAKVIYDAHEFESNHTANQNRLSIYVLQVLEGFLIRFVDRMVTVSEGIANEYARIYSIERPDVVLNVPWLQEGSNDNRLRKNFGIRNNQTIFLTQGWLRPNRGIEIMLETFAVMPDDSKVLVVMGRGILESMVDSYASESANIFHQPVVPPDQVIAHTSAADYGIALIRGVNFSYQHCLPNKLFEYFMGGLPVIVSDLPEMRRVVCQMDLGVICENFTTESLNDACIRVTSRDRDVLSRNVATARAKFNWDVQQQVWLNVIAEVAG